MNKIQKQYIKLEDIKNEKLELLEVRKNMKVEIENNKKNM